MQDIQALQREIEIQLQSIYEALSEPASLYDPIRYIMSIGGKRMRPVLTLMACEMFGAESHRAISQAIGIEVFHNFTLLHDDIMDKAPLRRGQATVHEKWNTSIAILSGDAMFVKSVQLMMQSEQQLIQPILQCFTKAAIEVCEGQQHDMDFEQLAHISIEQYMHMIKLKTAVLLGAALEIGARVAGAKEEDARLMYDFGYNIGIAFQLQDDILDVYGESETFGKMVGGDILANKKTFLLLKAMELAGCEHITQFHEQIGVSAHSTDKDKIRTVTQVYNQYGVREIAMQRMEEFYNRAIEAISSIQTIDEHRKQPLTQLAAQLMNRNV